MDYQDEIYIDVKPEEFIGVCLDMHKKLASPIMSYFAVDERTARGVFVVYCAFLDAEAKRWVFIRMEIPGNDPKFKSLALDMYSASLFEREMMEMYGLEAVGSPDTRRLHLHDEVWPDGSYPLRKDFSAPGSGKTGAYNFKKVEGEGVFEVPVGPVHAGIIGPGHFRFSVAGEPIISLETRLGYTHRGVEKLFESKDPFVAAALSEAVSGDSVFSHSMAFCQAVEKIRGIQVPGRALLLRGVYLELERMYNHVADIGGIALDVGYSFPSMYASIIKESLLRVNKEVSGHRYLKNINMVGGVAKDIDEAQKKMLSEALEKILKDFRELEKMLFSSTSFMDRVDKTGVLKKKTASDLGVTGTAGRASGIRLDLRNIFSVIYKDAGFIMASQETGDVLARLNVRCLEFKESARLIKKFLANLKEGAISDLDENNLREGIGLGYTEGWRGPVLYWVKIARDGKIDRCKIVDPSFRNWQGLAFAVLGNIIPDFPLCNKSFNLSYSGNDL